MLTSQFAWHTGANLNIMKGLYLLCIASFCLTSSSSVAQTDSEFSLYQVDTSYVVYVGTFKNPRTFDMRDVPYQLVDLTDEKGRHMYFFGKFKTQCDAEYAQTLVYLAGLQKTKVRAYVDYKDNPDVAMYAHVCR